MICKSCGKVINLTEDFILYKPTNIGLGKKIYYKKYRMNLKGIKQTADDSRYNDLFTLCEDCYKGGYYV